MDIPWRMKFFNCWIVDMVFVVVWERRHPKGRVPSTVRTGALGAVDSNTDGYVETSPGMQRPATGGAEAQMMQLCRVPPLVCPL